MDVPFDSTKKYFSRVYALTPDDEICISGISGRFPNSLNMHEYAHNLYNKVDMVSYGAVYGLRGEVRLFFFGEF